MQKKLGEVSDNWRIRIGDYRAVDVVDDNIMVVYIRKVIPRKIFTKNKPIISKELVSTKPGTNTKAPP
ncbi:type II toxin-antitoxin system RelE/ParE family toxin [Belliella marina]|uniref:Type II toxin-antitoxin system RelE/ParE family toxin n=1 Tax=Belliella marina TaxID=1644146 RepID=A0ABW4VU40_9BACT